MPFQPLPDQSPEKPNSSDFGLFIVRFISVSAFVYYQLLDQLNLVRLFVWEKAEWPLIDQIRDMNLPMPELIAPTLIIVLAISLFGISLGIFTRINSLILFILTAFILLAPLDLSPTLTRQALVLYLALFLALACGGAGRVSLDYLMTGKKRPTK